MIEVEKQFEPTKEQYNLILQDADFLGEVINHDIYYDYFDNRLFKNEVKFRNRNGKFELKIRLSGDVDNEVENEEEIKKFFNTTEDLKSFVDNNLVVFIEYKNFRKKYKKDCFIIDIDKTDFGMESCDIEILVEKEEDVENAKNKIKDFADKYRLDYKHGFSKRAMYLKKFKPDLYQRLYA